MIQKAQIYNYACWVKLSDSEVLQKGLQSFLEKSGYSILNFVEHHFTGNGYTSLWLLGESHLALHTFPESGKSYIELSGCNKEYNDRFLELIKSEWQTYICKENTRFDE